MRTNRLLKITVLVMMATIVSPVLAVPVASTTPTLETPEQKLQRLTTRVEEIKSMDKSSLSKSERKALKKELRDIRDETKALSGGVYISLGALLVIVILLIVLL